MWNIGSLSSGVTHRLLVSIVSTVVQDCAGEAAQHSHFIILVRIGFLEVKYSYEPAGCPLRFCLPMPLFFPGESRYLTRDKKLELVQG